MNVDCDSDFNEVQDVLNRSAIEDDTLFDKLDDARKYIIIGSNDEIAASVFQNAGSNSLQQVILSL